LLRLFRIEHPFRKGVNRGYTTEKTAQFRAHRRCAVEWAPGDSSRRRGDGSCTPPRGWTRWGTAQNLFCAAR